ncbi:MAG TPA: hypothetical protein VFK86_09235, partial [Bauldia sp.]|nr:hypothetical protein [Bauldia sp.]
MHLRHASTRLQYPRFALFYSQRRQYSGAISAGVESDAIGFKIDDLADRVTMDDNAAMVSLVVEERRSDPPEVVGHLA